MRLQRKGFKKYLALFLKGMPHKLLPRIFRNCAKQFNLNRFPYAEKQNLPAPFSATDAAAISLQAGNKNIFHRIYR
jgi:hypothetical protein